MAARGGSGGNCPRVPEGGAPKEGGKIFLLMVPVKGGDRDIARGDSTNTYLIHGFITEQLKQWRSNQKRSLDASSQNIMRLGATNTTFAPGRQKPWRRHCGDGTIVDARRSLS
jgi:hypothetical protein